MGTRPDTSPYVHATWRCIAVSPTIIPPLSPPHVPSGINPSEIGMLDTADEHAKLNTATVPANNITARFFMRPTACSFFLEPVISPTSRTRRWSPGVPRRMLGSGRVDLMRVIIGHTHDVPEEKRNA